MSAQSHDLNVPLPAYPGTLNKELLVELEPIYATLNIMLLEITSLRARVKALEAYNAAHP